MPRVARVLVMAAVSVVLPWSTCPIVPTFTCGFVRSNIFLAIVSSVVLSSSCELQVGIGPTTSRLPSVCSATELLERNAAVPRVARWAGRDSNSRRRSQLIYSQPPLATWVPARAKETREQGPATAPPPDPYSLPPDSWYGEPTMGLEPATGGLQNRCSAN